MYPLSYRKKEFKCKTLTWHLRNFLGALIFMNWSVRPSASKERDVVQEIFLDAAHDFAMQAQQKIKKTVHSNDNSEDFTQYFV